MKKSASGEPSSIPSIKVKPFITCLYYFQQLYVVNPFGRLALIVWQWIMELAVFGSFICGFFKWQLKKYLQGLQHTAQSSMQQDLVVCKLQFTIQIGFPFTYGIYVDQSFMKRLQVAARIFSRKLCMFLIQTNSSAKRKKNASLKTRADGLTVKNMHVNKFAFPDVRLFCCVLVSTEVSRTLKMFLVELK